MDELMEMMRIEIDQLAEDFRNGNLDALELDGPVSLSWLTSTIHQYPFEMDSVPPSIEFWLALLSVLERFGFDAPLQLTYNTLLDERQEEKG